MQFQSVGGSGGVCVGSSSRQLQLQIKVRLPPTRMTFEHFIALLRPPSHSLSRQKQNRENNPTL
jgi:hypothetical protein